MIRIAAASARGQMPGGPRLAEARAISHARLKAGAEAHADAVMPMIREAQAAGAKSLRQIAVALNGRGIATARGGKWEAQTVANILRRSAAEGVKLGGLNAKAVQNRDEAKARAEALRPIFAELAGQSTRAIAAELNRRNVATPNGWPWRSMTVIRVQRRLAASRKARLSCAACARLTGGRTNAMGEEKRRRQAGDYPTGAAGGRPGASSTPPRGARREAPFMQRQHQQGDRSSRPQPQGPWRASCRAEEEDERRVVFGVGASRRIPHAPSLAVALHQGRGCRPSAF
jgi:hypothetical protein